MERTNRKRLVAITLVLAIVMIALVGVVATVGINDSTQIATAEYELTPSECTHNLIKIANVETNVTAVPINNANYSNIGVDSAWKNDDIVEGSTGVRFKFFYSGKSAKVTLTADLPEARTIDIYWQTGLGNPYAYGAVTITHNDEERVIDFRHGANESWNIDHIQCDAGFNTFTYAFVSESYSWGDPDGRWFQVMPEYIPTFDEIDRCTQCGLTCSHATSSMGYDDDEHYYVCYDICKKRFAATENEHSIDSNGDCLYCGYTRMEKDKEGYYLIGNPCQLAVFTKYVNVDGHTAIKGRLTADIDLNGQKFDPIGTAARMFIGEFDGQNHRIYNVNLNLEETDCVGFFGIAGSNNSGSAYIHNLTIDRSCSFRGKKYVGGLIGAVSGEILIKYCGNEANATVINLTMKDATAGGIIGHGGVATIQYCYNTGNVTGGSECWNEYYYGSGGITGKMDGFTIEHSYNSGTVNTTLCGGGSNSNTGHRFNTFANSFGDQSVVADCYNYEAVEDAHFTATQYTSLTDGSMLALLNVGAKTPFVQSATHPIFVAARQLVEEAGCTHEYVVAKYEWADNHSPCKGIAICKNCGKVLAEEKSSNSSTVTVPTDPGLLQTTYTVEFDNKDVFQPQKTTIVYAMSTIYTVTLHANGGTGTPCTFYYKGVGTTLPTDYLKDGKYIEGWYDNSGLTGSKVTEIPSNATGNKDFYAKYENHTCTLEDYEGQAATCTVAGRTAGKRCTTCGVIREGGDVIRPLGHDYHYSASGASLTATCSHCSETATITLVRNGSDVSIDDTTAWQEHGFAIPEILYIGIDSTVYEESSIAPTADGDYRARIKKSGQEAELTFAISGGTANPGGNDNPGGNTEPATHEHNDITFTAWESTNSLPTSAGSYYLTADVTISSTWNVPSGTSNLCLNGHVISAASNVTISVITVKNGSTLNLYDCDTTTHYYYVDANTYVQNRAPAHNEMRDIGAIAADGPTDPGYVAATKKGTFTGGYITGGTGQGLTFKSGNISGGGFQIYGGGTLNMYGGCIFGNYTSAIGSGGNEGGGVYVYQNGVFNMNGGYIVGNQGGNAGGAVHNSGTFTMNDGYIGHNTAGDGGWAYGGGINNVGTMTMNGGVIEGNEAGGISIPIGRAGGGIYNDGSLTINGGSVINNCSKEFGGGIYVSSKASLTIGGGVKITGNYNVNTTKADNVYLDTDKKITLASALTEKNSVGVTLKSGEGTFTSGWSTYMDGKDPADYFIADNDDYAVVLKAGEAQMVKRWYLEDPEAPSVKVEIVGADDVDPELVENIKVEVTVKAEIETNTSENNYQEITKTYVDANEEIAFVYEVKLIQKIINPVTGEETMKEIQPSEIKEGATIKVTMEIPEALQGKTFKLLHIHAANDVEYINNYVVSEDGKTVEVEINRLSEIAFVADKAIAAEECCHGFCIGWIVFIFVMLDLLYLALYLILLLPIFAFIAVKLGALKEKKCLLGKIGTCVAAAVFIFALVALCVHQCAASIVSFIFALLILAAYVVIAVLGHKGFFKDEEKTVVDEEKEESAVIAAPTEEAEGIGFYHITKDEEGKCTYTLYYEEGDKLSKEMGVFASEKEAYNAIKHLREIAVGAKAENRVKNAGETIPAPKFVLDVNDKGVYRYSFLDEDGSVLMQSVQYLNEKRCLEDLKKTLNAVATEEVVVENGELQEDVIDAVEETVEEAAADEAEEEAPIEEATEEESKEEAGVSLKENIAIAKATVSHSAVNKQYVADYLRLKYASGVECNLRGNETKTGLPLADTHYAVAEDGKKCFVYVYDVEGTTMLLVKVDDEYGKALAEKHPIVKRSAFPKSKSPWQSVIVDDSFTAEEIEKLLDDAYLMNGGKPAADEGLTLKESLAMAKATTVTIHRSKKGIADYLAEEYGDKAELNLRVNKTKTGLPLADTHYAVREDGKTCFVYVYETNGVVILLLRLTEEYAKTVEEAGHKIIRSAFPKSKDAWFTVILDDTFTEDDIQELLDAAYDQAK